MDWKKDIGKISQIPLHGKRYEWVIADFFSMPQKHETRLISPEFRFEGQRCCLGLWPCIEDNLGMDWIGLNLWISPSYYPVTLDISVKLGLLSYSGEEYKSCSVQFHDEYSQKQLFSYERPNFLPRAEFMREVSVIAPYGKIVVFCEIRKKEEAEVIVSPKNYSFSGPEFWAA